MDSHRHLMLAPDSARRSDIATDVGMAVVAEGGVSVLTPKAVGDRLGCSRQDSGSDRAIRILEAATTSDPACLSSSNGNRQVLSGVTAVT